MKSVGAINEDNKNEFIGYASIEKKDSEADSAVGEQNIPEKMPEVIDQPKPEQNWIKARIKRVSTKRKTHHVETVELDFFDDFADDEDSP